MIDEIYFDFQSYDELMDAVNAELADEDFVYVCVREDALEEYMWYKYEDYMLYITHNSSKEFE